MNNKYSGNPGEQRRFDKGGFSPPEREGEKRGGKVVFIPAGDKETWVSNFTDKCCSVRPAIRKKNWGFTAGSHRIQFRSSNSSYIQTYSSRNGVLPEG